MNEKLYINIFDYVKKEYPFQIFIGGRGIGKTYSALKGCLIDNEKPFIYMRRTQEELDVQSTINPFKAINKDFLKSFNMFKENKKVYNIYEEKYNEETKKYEPVGNLRGYGVALSTISGIRGIDLSDCQDIIYDEFIPEKHIRKIKNECDALLNAYETMNRNREFIGAPAMRLWLLSNSNDIYSPIFIGLNIVNHIEKMIRKGKHDIYLPDRGLAIHLLQTPQAFKNKKQNTALYKLATGTDFADMSLNNTFAYNDFSNCQYMNIKGFRPLCAIDNAYIYKKKGQSMIYISYSQSNTDIYKSTIESDLMDFKRKYGLALQDVYISGNMYFESMDLKNTILSIII